MTEEEKAILKKIANQEKISLIELFTLLTYSEGDRNIWRMTIKNHDIKID